jgi:serine/threonine-protein kinase
VRAAHRSAVVPRDDLPTGAPAWRVVVVLLAVGALFGLSALAAGASITDASSSGDLPRIELPPTRGLKLPDAEAKLRQLGFSVDIDMRPSEGAPRGTVFGQRPEAGAKVEQGDVVTLLVSDGESGLPLPDVTGRQLDDAKATLFSGGWTAVAVPVPDETVPVGEVMTMTPAPGKRVVDGAAVTLSVSSGPAPRKVPQLVGGPMTEAMISLGRLGLGVGKITRTATSDQPAGTVLATDPPAGAEVPRDYPVQLTVVGPPPTVDVPYLVGSRQSSAESTLRSVGLKAQVIVHTVAPGDPNDGKVTGQSVPGGAPLAPGSTVQLTVSSSGNPPPPNAPTIPPTTAPPPAPPTAPPTTPPPPTAPSTTAPRPPGR